MRLPFLHRRPQGPQRVEPTDPDFRQLLTLGAHEGDVAADEAWILHGEDGSPVAAAYLRRDAADPQTVHAWLTVDPVLRRYGTGERVFAHVVERARALGARRLASWADNQSGYSFLVDHGFVATTTGDDPTSQLVRGPRIDGVLQLG